MKDEYTHSSKRCGRCGNHTVLLVNAGTGWACYTCNPQMSAKIDGHIDVEGLTRKGGYNGFFKIGVYDFTHGLFKGGQSEALTREVFERGNAVAVLPYCPKTDQVLLIQQFLIGAHLAGVENRPLQVIAGMVEDGESSAEVALREAQEEAGVTQVREILSAQSFLPSPGGSSERVETFVAHADLTDAGGIHGLQEEGEDIRAVKMTAQDAIDLLDAGEIEAGPAVVLLSWFARHHAHIRNEWLSQ